MSFSAPARTRAYIAAGLALTLGGLSACKSDSLLQVTDPDILNISDYNTPAGADPLRVGVINLWTAAFDGSDNFVVSDANMTDQALASDTFDDRLSVNARKSVETNATQLAVYQKLQQARASATSAIKIIATTQPAPTFNRGELYMMRGYTEMWLGELYCSGVPFSSEDGVTNTYGQPNTTAQIMTIASATFDSSIALADTNKRVRYGAEIGKGRAQLNLGNFTAAAAAVTDVPQSFVLTDFHSSGTTSNGLWSAFLNGATRYMITTSEGINGLPYLKDHSDPRINWSPSTRTGFASPFTNEPNENKFGRYDASIVSTGVEAKLMGLEATLQANTQAARDQVYAGLNALRSSGPPAGVPLLTSGSPQTQDAAITLLYNERAYWMWLTGHRLGDMRRLVGIYKRDPETVFPTGPLPLPLIGNYGTETNVVIPAQERNNPNFKGCLPGA